MQAIVLAGGFGTRLKQVVADVPKPMAPVNERPFLEYILDELNDYGFDKAVLAVGYKKEIIIDHFGQKYKNVRLDYSIEDEPLGTGGCVKKAMSMIDDDFFFVVNGDTLFKIDFHKMAEFNSIAIACKGMVQFDRYGEVIIDNGFIKSFLEKKYVEKGFINGGIYYLSKSVFNKYNLPNKFSLEKDFFEKYASELNIRAFISNDYFIDIGIPEDYKKAEIDLSVKKALFLDRDGIINVDYGHVYKIEDFVFTNDIFDICKDYQDKGYMIFVITNQAGIGKGLYTENDFIRLNDYMLSEFKNHGINIQDVYYCPHSPEDGCDCRKPNPGLFIRAIKDYNIDASKSIAIGDKLSDLEAANKAGVGKLIFKKTDYNEYPVDFKYERM